MFSFWVFFFFHYIIQNFQHIGFKQWFQKRYFNNLISLLCWDTFLPKCSYCGEICQNGSVCPKCEGGMCSYDGICSDKVEESQSTCQSNYFDNNNLGTSATNALICSFFGLFWFEIKPTVKILNVKSNNPNTKNLERISPVKHNTWYQHSCLTNRNYDLFKKMP